jgi:hypothetical protein
MKAKRRRLLIAALAPLLSASCSDSSSYEDQERSLRDFLEQNRMGSSSDVWIVKGDTAAGPAKVGLVFGYGDDMAACFQLIGLMNQQYPTADFQCQLAN